MDAATKTEASFEKDKLKPRFCATEATINHFLDLYMIHRSQYVPRHKCKNLLKNYKVAALYVFVLTNRSAEDFFSFPAGTPASEKRVVLVSFMLHIITGIMQITLKDFDKDLLEDLEYCLMVEAPENLEWLCLTMHAFCKSVGTPVTTAV